MPVVLYQGDGTKYIYIETIDDIPSRPNVGDIVKFVTAVSGLTDFVDVDNVTEVTAASVDDGFRWSGSQWEKRETAPTTNDAGDYFYIDTVSELPASPAVGVIIEITTAISSGLTNFVDRDGSTPITSAAVGDGFEWNGTKWVKKVSAPQTGGGTNLTIGTSFPASPASGSIHKLNAATNLQVVSYSKTLSGSSTFAQFGSGAGKVIWGDWQGVANNSYFLGLNSTEAAHFTSLVSGDKIFIGSNEIILTGAPTYNSGLSLLIISSYSNTINANPFSNGTTYIAVAYPASTAFNKADEFRFNGNVWEQVFDADVATAFKVSSVTDGTLDRADKVVAEDVSGSNTPNIASTIANLFALIEASDIRYEFIADKTSAYTIVAADERKIVPVDTSSANVTITLPDLNSNDDGFKVTVMKIAAANTVTIDGNGSDTINGSSNTTMTENYHAMTLGWDGTEWFILVEVNNTGGNFQVSSVTDGTLARSDKIVAEDVSASGTPNIASTIANMFALIQASDIRSEFEGVKTAAYTVVTTDEGKVIPMNTASGNLTVNLPDLSTGDEGFSVIILKTSASNTLTISPNGTDQINGGSTLSITGGDHAVLILWDGSAWWMIAEANRPASAVNVTLANLPRMKADYVYAGAGTGSAVAAKPVFDTTEAQQTNGTLDYDSGTQSGSDSAGPNDPADYGDVSDPSITSEAFAGGRLYRLAAGYDFTALRIRFDGTVTQGVAFQVRYSTTKPTTTNLSSHGTQLQQVGTVSNVFEQDGTISNPADELYFWGVPTATRTITSRKLHLDGSYSKTENVDVDGVIELGAGLEIDDNGRLKAIESGLSLVTWLTSAAFVNGDLAATGTLDFTKDANAPTDVADGANTKCSVPKTAPDNVTGIRVQLLTAAHVVEDELDIPWGDTSSVLSRKLELDSNSYASFTFDLVSGTTPTFTFTAENTDNGLTGYYIKISAILLAPNQTYTPVIPKTPNGVHRRCIAELEGTTGSTAPGLSLMTASYTPQHANARIYIRLRILASCVGNSDNDYSQICVRVKRGTGNYKRIDEGADGFTPIFGTRMWQYGDGTARAHYDEFELEPEDNTDEIKVNLSIYMKDGATVTSATGRLNRWGDLRNAGPSFLEIYELMENGTLTRTTITTLDAA